MGKEGGDFTLCLHGLLWLPKPASEKSPAATEEHIQRGTPEQVRYLQDVSRHVGGVGHMKGDLSPQRLNGSSRLHLQTGKDGKE